jgi:hypothetical protein
MFDVSLSSAMSLVFFGEGNFREKTENNFLLVVNPVRYKIQELCKIPLTAWEVEK